MKDNFIEVVGWIGMIMIILAYGLVSFSIIKPSFLYQILSGGGSIGIIIISFKKRAYQPAFLNIIWLIIALIAITKLFI